MLGFVAVVVNSDPDRAQVIDELAEFKVRIGWRNRLPILVVRYPNTTMLENIEPTGVPR